MSTKVCELTQEQKTTCDTSCHVELSPELWKTGVMIEEDVRTIRKLKKTGRSFNYDKGKRAHNIDFDQLTSF